VFGQGATVWWIPVREVIAAIRIYKANGLPYFHAFTGCDIVSAFCLQWELIFIYLLLFWLSDAENANANTPIYIDDADDKDSDDDADFTGVPHPHDTWETVATSTKGFDIKGPPEPKRATPKLPGMC